MCGRMYIEPEDPTGELHSILATLRFKNEIEAISVKLSGEIFPSNIIPVIIEVQGSEQAAVPMKWGFPRFDSKGLIINARSETAAIKPTFRQSAKNMRCIIPVSYYFEWQSKEKEKIKYSLRPSNGSLAYIAGLYKIDSHSGGQVFTVLTRQADDKISFIHNRMPVILPKQLIYEWLSPHNSFDEFINRTVGELDYKIA